MIDGWHRGRTLRERLRWEVIWRTVQFTIAAIRDVRHFATRSATLFVPVVAEPGRTAVFTEPEAKRTFEALGGEEVGWRDGPSPHGSFSRSPAIVRAPPSGYTCRY